MGVSAAPIPPGAGPLVERARGDLAQRSGVSAEEIRVVRVEPVEWRDSSLGVPRPGRMYAQVITPGWRIVLLAGQELAEYHADGRRVILAD